MTEEKQQEVGPIKMVMTCERCGEESVVQQRDIWRSSRDLDFGDHVPVPNELFSLDLGFCFNESKFREESFICSLCYEAYAVLREKLLKAVNKNLLSFLENETLQPSENKEE